MAPLFAFSGCCLDLGEPHVQLPDLTPAGSALGYGVAPFPFFSVVGRDAVAAVDALRTSYQDATPVIWGDADDAARLFEIFGDDTAPAASDTLRAAEARTAAQLLELWRDGIRAGIAEYERSRGRSPAEWSEPEPPSGDFPNNVVPHGAPLSIIDFASRAPKEKVLIGLIPTARAWEVAAYHKFGGWNDCPPPAAHVAIAREWSERYGARLIANTADVLEFEVDRPITNRDEAIALALEQFRYCADIVYQSAGTVDALAGHLLGARYWYLWWD